MWNTLWLAKAVSLGLIGMDMAGSVKVGTSGGMTRPKALGDWQRGLSHLSWQYLYSWQVHQNVWLKNIYKQAFTCDHSHRVTQETK